VKIEFKSHLLRGLHFKLLFARESHQLICVHDNLIKGQIEGLPARGTSAPPTGAVISGAVFATHTNYPFIFYVPSVTKKV